jgi:hypothetical protein
MTKGIVCCACEAIYKPGKGIPTPGHQNLKEGLPLIQINLSFFAYEIGKPPANSTNGCKSKHNLLFAIDVGVENTQNVLEIILCNERLHNTPTLEYMESHDGRPSFGAAESADYPNFGTTARRGLQANDNPSIMDTGCFQ